MEFSKHALKVMQKRDISEKEVLQAFNNRRCRALLDDREDHQTDPPSMWIIADTNYLRSLCIVFMVYVEEQKTVVKTVFEPNRDKERLYFSNATPLKHQ